MDSGSRLIFVSILFPLLGMVSTGFNKQERVQNETHLRGRGISQEKISNLDQIIISTEEPYSFLVQCQKDPAYQFQLWFPELAIFDQDSVRADIEYLSDKDNWVEKIKNGFLVYGKAQNDNYQAAFRYKIMKVSDEEIRIELEVKNTGRMSWSGYAQLAYCISPRSPAFSDKTGSRTFIHTNNNQLTSLTDAGPVHDFNHYPVKPGNDSNDKEQRIPVLSGFVGRASTDEERNIIFYWEKAARVDVNPGGLDCIHSHPAIGPLEPGESLVNYGYIRFGNESLQDRFKLIRIRSNDKSHK